MKKLLLTILFVFCLINLSFGQEIYENKQFDFSIQKPSNWFMTENKRLLDMVKTTEMTDENVEKILKSFEGALLVAFQKYNPQGKVALNPIIQVNIRPNPTKNFRDFKNSMIISSDHFKQLLEDYKLTEEIKEVKISGIKSLFFVAEFKYKAKDGTKLNTRTRTYAIPYKNYFFQVNFTDGNDGNTKEDSTKIFDELVKTIKIGEVNKN